MATVEIFFCYAREDEVLRKGLEKQLRSLKRQGLINVWHDREIVPGVEWESEIDKHLNTAEIILLLISPDFMDSEYCYGIEMKRAMERHERGEAIVIPIVLRHVYWQGAPFGKLQALPTNAKPVKSWPDLDEAFFDVAEGIRKTVGSLLVQQAKAQGDTYTTAGQYKEALVAYEQAIQLEPNDAGAYNGRGIILVKLGIHAEALIAFEQAIRLDPYNASAFNNKGSALGNLNHFNEALAAFEQAINLDPQNAQIFINKGYVLNELQCYREALTAFEQAELLDFRLKIPKNQYVKWAQELLALPNLAFLEVDTTGLQEDDEIIRILMINRTGDSLLDIFLHIDETLSDEIRRITGISDSDLEFAPTFSDAWEEITLALKENYILSFNLEFDQGKLEAAAKRYKLEMPLIIGDCLMQNAMKYSGSYSYSKLSYLCDNIDYPLPKYPFQTALDRAKGQIAILEAISKGLTLEIPEEWSSNSLDPGESYDKEELVDYSKLYQFTVQARNVLHFAHAEAFRYQHTYIGTEHILLGLLCEEKGVARKVLDNLGVSINKVRTTIDFKIGPGEYIERGEIGLTSTAKKIIELAVGEAVKLNHQFLDTEHLLLGILGEQESAAAIILKNLGLNLDKVRISTLNVIVQQKK